MSTTPNKHSALQALRQRLSCFDTANSAQRLLQPESGGYLAPALFATGLHEIIGETPVDFDAALAFALIAAGHRRMRGRALFVATSGNEQEHGALYGAGLDRLGLDPARICLLVAPSEKALLWAAEEAASCPALAATVIALGAREKLYGFTASRRLKLRQEKSGVPIFIVRCRSGEATAVQEPRKLYVLAVGVTEYKRPDWRLKFAASDAEAISKALQAVGKGVFGDNIVIMPPLLNDKGTEPDIAAAFQRLAQMVKPQDVFVLFLSGHGRSIAGKGWYFLPPNLEPGQRVEDHAIGQDKLQTWLSQIAAQKSVIILDSCEAGATEGFRSIERERDSVMAQLEHATGRNTISAAGQGKAAYEGYKQHGLLTYALLEALNRKESEGDDVVDLYAMGGYISRRVPEISLEQFNLYQQPKADLKDNFPLGRRQPILKSIEIACELPKTSASPSHVTSATVAVRKGPSGGGPTVAELKFRAGVTVIGCQGAWALISRDGMEPGYVRYEALEHIE